MAHATETSHYSLVLRDRGRLVLPAKVRRELGLKKGERLVLHVAPSGDMKLNSLRRAAAKYCGILKGIAPGRSLADELIAERREEARREELE